MYEADDGAKDDTALALVGEVITRWLEVARMAWNVPAKPSLSSRQQFSGHVTIETLTPLDIEELAAKVLVS